MDRSSWMYGSLRWKQGFCDGVNAFIEATEKNAASKNETKILCPCSDCKNNLLWGDWLQSDRTWSCGDLWRTTPYRSIMVKRSLLMRWMTRRTADTWTHVYMNLIVQLEATDKDHQVVWMTLMVGVLGKMMMVIIWRNCFGTLDRRCYSSGVREGKKIWRGYKEHPGRACTALKKVAVAECPKPGSEIQCYRQRRPVAHHLSNHYITTKLYEKQKVQGYGRNSELNRGRGLRLHRILNYAVESKHYSQLL